MSSAQLDAPGVSLIFEIGANQWCELFASVGGIKHPMGSELFSIIVERLAERFAERSTWPQMPPIEVNQVNWAKFPWKHLLMLSAGHSSFYANRNGQDFNVVLEGSGGQMISRFRLTEEFASKWEHSLQRWRANPQANAG